MQEILGDCRNIPYLYWVCGYVGAYICHNSSVSHLRYVYFTICKFHSDFQKRKRKENLSLREAEANGFPKVLCQVHVCALRPTPRWVNKFLFSRQLILQQQKWTIPYSSHFSPINLLPLQSNPRCVKSQSSVFQLPFSLQVENFDVFQTPDRMGVLHRMPHLCSPPYPSHIPQSKNYKGIYTSLLGLWCSMQKPKWAVSLLLEK